VQRSGGAEEEERTDNVWIQSSRNPTQNFVHPGAGVAEGVGGTEVAEGAEEAEGDTGKILNSQFSILNSPFPNNK